MQKRVIVSDAYFYTKLMQRNDELSYSLYFAHEQINS